MRYNPNMKERRLNRKLLGYVIDVLFQLAIFKSEFRLQLLDFVMDLSKAYYFITISSII